MSWVFTRISSAFFLFLRNSLIHCCICLQSRSEGSLAFSRAHVSLGRAPSFCPLFCLFTVPSVKGTNTCFPPLAITLIMSALYIRVWLYFYLKKMCFITKKIKKGLMPLGLGGSLGSGHSCSHIFSQLFSRSKWSFNWLVGDNFSNIFRDIFEV